MSKSKLSRRQVLITTATLATPALPACGQAAPEATPDASAPPPDPPVPPSPPLDAGSAPDAASPADGGVAKARSFPGVVVDVTHGGAVVGGAVQAGPVRQILSRAMRELTGEADEADAWRRFFSPGDVVGIKVNPFGYPKFFSQIATVQEIVRGLGLAGVTPDKIVIFDRYTEYLADVGYAAALPAGVRFASAIGVAGAQTDVTSFDQSEFVEFAKVERGDDINNPVHRRSYLSTFASTMVTKIINVPVLKDHASAGVTFALKNMTYGLVNNTARTHDVDNWTVDFIPKVAAMPKLRDKVVLHVGDALIASYEGGPDPNDNTFDRGSLVVGTDPVAIDRVAWKIVNDQRAKVALAPVEADAARQPQYILACGAAGLGTADLTKIVHKTFAL